VTQSKAPKQYQRPRRAVEGALLGGLAGLVAAAIASKNQDDSFLKSAGVGALGGLAFGALAPIPLAEALEKAASFGVRGANEEPGVPDLSRNTDSPSGSVCGKSRGLRTYRIGTRWAMVACTQLLG
jgi:hypothetical protein